MSKVIGSLRVGTYVPNGHLVSLMMEGIGKSKFTMLPEYKEVIMGHSDCPGWETYYQLSIAEKAIARDNYGENVGNMLYDFRAMKAKECDMEIGAPLVDIVA